MVTQVPPVLPSPSGRPFAELTAHGAPDALIRGAGMREIKILGINLESPVGALDRDGKDGYFF